MLYYSFSSFYSQNFFSKQQLKKHVLFPIEIEIS